MLPAPASSISIRSRPLNPNNCNKRPVRMFPSLQIILTADLAVIWPRVIRPIPIVPT